MLQAELMIAAEDFPAARKAIGDLAETDPTARALTIMAAIERGEGSDDAGAASTEEIAMPSSTEMLPLIVGQPAATEIAVVDEFTEDLEEPIEAEIVKDGETAESDAKA